MRTLFTLLACAVCGAVATAALPPQPTAKTFDVAHLIGDDAPFATIEDLRKVVSVFLFGRGGGDEGCSIQIDPDSPTRLKVCEFDRGHRLVEHFLDTLHDVKRRRGMVVSTECLLLRMPAGGGEKLLLPQECDCPLILSAREAELTAKLVRHTKADVLARPKLELAHGREGSVLAPDQHIHTCFSTFDPAVRLKLKATISDDGKSVTLAGGVVRAAWVEFVPRTSHEGKFKGEVPVGGTAVVKVSPKLVDDKAVTDDELYVFVRVREVRPAVLPKGLDVANVELPSVNTTPKVVVPPVPPLAVPLPVGVPTVEVLPVPRTPSASLAPLRNYWDDIGPLRPLPGGFSISHGIFNFYVGWIGGQ